MGSSDSKPKEPPPLTEEERNAQYYRRLQIEQDQLQRRREEATRRELERQAELALQAQRRQQAAAEAERQTQLRQFQAKQWQEQQVAAQREAARRAAVESAARRKAEARAAAEDAARREVEEREEAARLADEALNGKFDNNVQDTDLILLNGEDREDHDVLLQKAEQGMFPTDHQLFSKELQANWEMNDIREKARGLADLEQVDTEGWDKERLKRSKPLDEKLFNEWKRRQNQMKSSKKEAEELPVMSFKDEILRLIRDNQVLLVSGGTGCGKTTKIPQFILDKMLSNKNGSLCRVVCTQPRRISAISVAERVAEERGERCAKVTFEGNKHDVNKNPSIGYQVRLEMSAPRPKGSILYCTSGIVLQWMRENPLLHGYSHIILDEVHERDINCDLLLATLREILPLRRDLKLILMSATVNQGLFSRYFNDCPTIEIPGEAFPVDEFYLEDIVRMTGFREAPRHNHYRGSRRKNNKYDDKINLDIICKLVEFIDTTEKAGSILIFLPGWEDISSLLKKLKSTANIREKVQVLPLHSQLSTADQKRVFLIPRDGIRKVIVATNIAETSITIPDVVYVIDSGKMKLKSYDHRTKLCSLKSEWIAQANATQRRGRAGRVQPGICFKLYTRTKEQDMEGYLQPEMQRTQLEQVILTTKSLALGKVNTFLQKVLSPPTDNAINSALVLLENIKAITLDEDLTPLGFNLCKLSMDPHLGRLILYAIIFGCLDPILTVVAILDYKDPFRYPDKDDGETKDIFQDARLDLADGIQSDHIVFINLLKKWIEVPEEKMLNQFYQENYVSSSSLYMLDKMKKKLATLIHFMGFIRTPYYNDQAANCNALNQDVIRAVLCAGLYPNVIHRKELASVAPDGKPQGDGKATIHPKSLNRLENEFDTPWIAYYLKMASSRVFLHDTSTVTPISLCLFGQCLQKLIFKRTVGSETQFYDVAVDGDACFQMQVEKEMFDRLQRLRKLLGELLDHVMSNPKIVDWSDGSKEQACIDALVFLVEA